MAQGKVFKRFVKRKVEDKNEQGEVLSTEYQLFKLAGYTKNDAAVYFRTNKLGVNGYGNNVKEYIGDGKTSIFPQNNVSLPLVLQNMNELLEQRGNTGPEENLINFVSKQEGEIEDRIAFCIMK
jgi:hypothetical protein